MARKTMKSRQRLQEGKFTLPSPAEILAAARTSPSGQSGWKAMKLAEWGVPWPPPKGWRADLEKRWREKNEPAQVVDRWPTKADESPKPAYINQGGRLECNICGTPTQRVIITTGATYDGLLMVRVFCSSEHASQGGFPWAGL